MLPTQEEFERVMAEGEKARKMPATREEAACAQRAFEKAFNVEAEAMGALLTDDAVMEALRWWNAHAQAAAMAIPTVGVQSLPSTLQMNFADDEAAWAQANALHTYTAENKALLKSCVTFDEASFALAPFEKREAALRGVYPAAAAYINCVRLVGEGR